jgi:hypothetical protein
MGPMALRLRLTAGLLLSEAKLAFLYFAYQANVVDSAVFVK